MGSSDVARVDLGSFAVGWFRGVGLSPRHVVLDPAAATSTPRSTARATS